MKPIRLSLKGLNSFQEEQVVDFNELTKHGLFGVFGPTGSGKSSILDGMTLALYGKTSRDSSNFINTQTDRMQVGFEFSINDVVYHVVRTYKRTPQGKINASKPTRIEEVRTSERILLEDQTKEVDKKCFDIIGLKFEDFIRTVVLPQGKFSEFIQLKGKERREMLERLFSLSRYGDDLTRKLMSAIRKEKDKDQVLTGELKGFEEVNKDNLKELETSFDSHKTELNLQIKKTKEAKKVYDESVKLFELIKKLETNKEQLNIFLEQEDSITKLKAANKLGRKLLSVQPYYIQYTESKQLLEDYQANLTRNKSLYETSKLKYEQEAVRFDSMTIKYNTFIADFSIKQLKLKEGIKVQKQINVLNTEVNSKEDDLKQSVDKITILKDEIGSYETSIKSLSVSLVSDKEALKALNIDAAIRKSIDHGYEKEIESKRIKRQLENLSGILLLAQEKIAKKSQEILDIESSLETKEKVFSSEEKLTTDVYLKLLKDLQSLESISIRDKEDFVKQSDLLLQKQEDLNKLNVTMKPFIKEFDAYTKAKELSYVKTLQNQLLDGESCPVCGSKEHSFEISMDLFNENVDLEKTMKDMIVKETVLKENIIEQEKRVNSLKLNIKDYDGNYSEQIKSLNDKFGAYNAHLEQIKSLQSDQKREQALLENEQEQLKKQTFELENLQKEYKTIKDILLPLYELHKIDNFDDLRMTVYKNLEQSEKLSSEIESKQSHIDQKKNALQVQKDSVDKLNTELMLLEQQIKQLRNDIFSNKQKLMNDFGEQTELENMLVRLISERDEILLSYETIKKNNSKLKKELDDYLLDYKKYEALTESTSRQYDAVKIQLDELIKKHSLSLDLLRVSEWTEEKLNACLKEVEAYQLNRKAVEVLIDDLSIQLDGQVMTSEIIEVSKSIVDTCMKEEKEIQKQLTTLEKEILDMSAQIQKLEGLLDKKKAQEHKLSLLHDLDYLFRGKKFVEYVASYQLRYISIEASKRLYDITSGKYGLEVDDQGKFLIRDFGHGGMTRDTSTLSGGESFLVSLSLALSLSSQIQLKGAAPLELFFLDEGFGTLDERFLEIVMSSLEQIHHPNLSIGLISHVESIKNRVPVKLNVSPSIPGIRGSQVKVERS